MVRPSPPLPRWTSQRFEAVAALTLCQVVELLLVVQMILRLKANNISRFGLFEKLHKITSYSAGNENERRS